MLQNGTKNIEARITEMMNEIVSEEKPGVFMCGCYSSDGQASNSFAAGDPMGMIAGLAITIKRLSDLQSMPWVETVKCITDVLCELDDPHAGYSVPMTADKGGKLN